MNTTRLEFALIGLLAGVTLCIAAPVHAQSGKNKKKCTSAQKERAQAHSGLGLNHKKLGAYKQAAREYLTAYDQCPRPFLLLYAGNMHWLDADKLKAAGQAGQNDDARELRVRALELYERYLAADPRGKGAPLAREQFHVFAKELWLAGDKQRAETYDKRYLELDPRGRHAAEAQARLDQLAAEREAERVAREQRAIQARQLAEQREAQAEEARRLADEREARRRADEQAARDAAAVAARKDQPRPGSTSRLLFWGTAGVAMTGAMVATITGLQVRGSLEQAKMDAINDYQTATGVQLDIAHACNHAEVVGNAPAVVAACDAGFSRATLTNVMWGVTFVSAAAAGFFYYKGYLAGPNKSKPQETAILPTFTPSTVGAQVFGRF